MITLHISRKAAVLGLAGIALFFFLLGAGTQPLLRGGTALSGQALYRFLDRSISSRLGKAAGPTLANIEDEVISRAMFDTKLELILRLEGADDKQIAEKKKDTDFQQGLLKKLAYNRVVCRELLKNPRTARKLELLILIHMSVTDALQKYFVMTKVVPTVDQKVDEKEIAAIYDKMREDPNYNQLLSRLPMVKVKQYITSRIIGQRTKQRFQDMLEKLIGSYRIHIKDDAFGKQGKK